MGNQLLESKKAALVLYLLSEEPPAEEFIRSAFGKMHGGKKRRCHKHRRLSNRLQELPQGKNGGEKPSGQIRFRLSEAHNRGDFVAYIWRSRAVREMREKDGTSILNKQVTGPVDSIIVEGIPASRQTDYIIYLHVPDSIRLKTEFAATWSKGRKTVRNPSNEIFSRGRFYSISSSRCQLRPFRFDPKSRAPVSTYKACIPIRNLCESIEKISTVTFFGVKVFQLDNELKRKVANFDALSLKDNSPRWRGKHGSLACSTPPALRPIAISST